MKLGLLALGLLLAGVAGATPTPLTCTSGCVIAASSVGYNPPVFDVAAGVPLVWHSTDIAHLQVEGVTAVMTPGGGCLDARSSGGRDSQPIVFAIHDGALWGSLAGANAVHCKSATAAPDGSFAMLYYCEIHPFTMRAALTVR